MNNRLFLFQAVWLLLLAALPAWSQTPTAASSFVQAARGQAITLHKQATNEQAHVYEGNEYIMHDRRIKVHPFYRTDSLQPGTVTYNGIAYDRLKLQYDVVRDELSIQPIDIPFRLRLRNEYVTDFSLNQIPFTRIVSDSTVGIPTGFYEVLYAGTVKALTRRIKTVHEDISQGFYKADYLVKDRFFILKDGAYHEVKTKRALLAVFADQGKVLRKFMRAQELTFKEDTRETTVSRVAQRYDELTRQP